MGSRLLPNQIPWSWDYSPSPHTIPCDFLLFILHLGRLISLVSLMHDKRRKFIREMITIIRAANGSKWQQIHLQIWTRSLLQWIMNICLALFLASTRGYRVESVPCFPSSSSISKQFEGKLGTLFWKVLDNSSTGQFRSRHPWPCWLPYSSFVTR